MPTLSVYRHGSTMGTGNPDAVPPVRSAVQGWSSHAVRRNILFLYSVDERSLERLHGCSFTLTVRDCPETPEAWQKGRDALLVALRRSGAVLVHWVTEWQRRGVPHLHLACYWSEPFDPSEVVRHWLRIAAPFSAKASGQHSHPIYDVLGWNQYVSKHAARGLHHYQRNPAHIPQTWRSQSTGRMWGKLGSWPVVPASKLDVDLASYHRLRRLVRSWRLADARRLVRLPDRSLVFGKAVAIQSGTALKLMPGWRSVGYGLMVDARRIRSARGMLRCPNPRLSGARGFSEWMPQQTMLQAVGWVSSIEGAQVESV
jgi:hypothetical protein